MRRVEYRLAITWPDGASYGKHVRTRPAALRAITRYRAEGAGVSVEVWGYAGEDTVRGWYRDARKTRELQAATAVPIVNQDARVQLDGSVCLVHLGAMALEWVREHVSDPHFFGPYALVVEPRYLDDLVAGMRADGLVVV